MKKLKILKRILKQTGADKMLLSFLGVIMLSAFLIWIWEPEIHTLGDAVWYCYAVITTIGFGDILVHTPVARIVSIFLSIYAILIIAIITGVVVNFYIHLVEMRNKDTLTRFLDRLEHLPELEKEELEEISEAVKKFRSG